MTEVIELYINLVSLTALLIISLRFCTNLKAAIQDLGHYKEHMSDQAIVIHRMSSENFFTVTVVYDLVILCFFLTNHSFLDSKLLFEEKTCLTLIKLVELE